jgi:hypothetical protein
MQIMVRKNQGVVCFKMNETESRSLFPASLTIIGAFLVGIATIFHPIIIDPWPNIGSLHVIRDSGNWTVDHGLMTVALIVWLVGLTWMSHQVTEGYSSSLFASSLAIWLLVLAVELAVLPYLTETVAETGNETLNLIGTLLFAFGLMAGYFAVVLVWIGVIGISWEAKRDTTYPRWLSTFGWVSGGIGLLGILYIFYDPEGLFSIIILGGTSGLPFLWIILFALNTIKRLSS